MMASLQPVRSSLPQHASCFLQHSSAHEPSVGPDSVHVLASADRLSTCRTLGDGCAIAMSVRGSYRKSRRADGAAQRAESGERAVGGRHVDWQITPSLRVASMMLCALAAARPVGAPLKVCDVSRALWGRFFIG